MFMKKFILIAFLSFISFKSFSETTIEFITPGAPSGAPMRIASASLGINFNNVVDEVSEKINELEIQLEATLIDAVLAEPRVRSVGNVLVNADQIGTDLSQLGNKVKLKVHDVGITFVDVKVDGILPILCSSIEFDTTLENLTLLGDYDRQTGQIDNLSLNFSVDVFNRSCGGILGLVTDLFAGSLINDKLVNTIEATLNRELVINDSVMDIRNLQRELVSDFSLLSAVGTLFDVASTIIAIADTFDDQGISLSVARGLNLDIVFNRKENIISFLGRQETPAAIIERLPRNRLTLTVLRNDNAAGFDIYEVIGSRAYFRTSLPASGGSFDGCSDTSSYAVVAKRVISAPFNFKKNIVLSSFPQTLFPIGSCSDQIQI